MPVTPPAPWVAEPAWYSPAPPTGPDSSRLATQIIGAPDTVQRGIADLVDATQASAAAGA